jgi:exportin-5
MHDGKSGGVFGEDGTAGSVVAGTDRRDVNIVPKWSGWLNELRNTCYQMFGLLATGRAMFSPELASMYPRLVAVMVDPISLKSMEHRFITQFLKHVVELLLVSCPSTMYATHLEPLIGPIFEHMRFRLEKSWLPVISPNSSNVNGSLAEVTRALTTSDREKAAMLASRGGDDWFSYCYAHSGLFVGDLESVTAEAAVEKHRVEISRTFSDILQIALALKGDWALVLANLSKEEQATKRGDATKLATGPRNRFLQHDENSEVNADGTLKTPHQSGIDARKMLRINGLCHFLLLENERIAGSLTVAVIQCLSYPDAYTCRRITKICHRIIETVAWSPQYCQLLSQQMFTLAIKNIVTEPKWMIGIEWDMINVVRDLYCRLVLGQILQPGGLGAGQQQSSVGLNSNQYEQGKTADRPLQGGGILVVSADAPRQILLSLPGIGRETVEELERNMKRKRSAKDQKDLIRDLLRVAADNLKDLNPVQVNAAANGIFDRAVEEESLLHSKRQVKAIPDLPEKLVTRSQIAIASIKKYQPEVEGLSAFQL